MTINKIQLLEEKAKLLKELKEKHGKRRPVLIEFSGTPKSGKTTSITALNIFLKRNGFTTEVIHEMASICPINNKTNPNFNTWTLFSSLSELIKLHSDNTIDFILVDRSIFDALCWFKWLNTSNVDAPYLDNDAFKAYENLIIGSKLLSGLFSLTLVFIAEPNICMKREFTFLLTKKKGSIMNEHVLSSFNNSIEICLQEYESQFNKIVKFDTSNEDKPEQVNLDVTESTLDALLNLIKEDIGYLKLERSKLSNGVLDFSIIKNEQIFFGDREKIESSEYIQPIPIAVITNESSDKVLIVKKSEKKADKSSPERNKHLIYIGGHVRQEDKSNRTTSLFEILCVTLNREILEEIGESIYVTNITPFLIFSDDNPKSKKHLAVCFHVKLKDFDHKNFKILSEELVKKTGNSKSGHTFMIDEVQKELSGDFENWSKYILKHVFKRDAIRKQTKLFEDLK